VLISSTNVNTTPELRIFVLTGFLQFFLTFSTNKHWWRLRASFLLWKAHPWVSPRSPVKGHVATQPNPPNFSIRAGSSLPTQVKGPPAAERTPTQHTTPATPRPVNNTTPGASYNNARRTPPRDDFSPIPMAYSELWPSLLENHLVVAIPKKVFQPPYP